MADPGTLTRPAEPDERGTTTIADRVVERVASIAASEVEAVTQARSGWASAVRRSLPRASATVAGSTARISVDVAAVWPTPLSSLAAEVRDHVSAQVTALTGVEVLAVDVSVADVVRAQAARRRVA